MKTQCAYCGNDWKEKSGACDSCGAPNKLSKIERFDPFFYDGYIVYALRDFASRSHEFVFYRGVTLVGRVFIPDREMETWSPALDYMPIVIARLHEGKEEKWQIGL